MDNGTFEFQYKYKTYKLPLILRNTYYPDYDQVFDAIKYLFGYMESLKVRKCKAGDGDCSRFPIEILYEYGRRFYIIRHITEEELFRACFDNNYKIKDNPYYRHNLFHWDFYFNQHLFKRRYDHFKNWKRIDFDDKSINNMISTLRQIRKIKQQKLRRLYC